MKKTRNYVTIDTHEIKETNIQSLFASRDGKFYSQDEHGWYECPQYFNNGTGNWRVLGYYRVRYNNKLYLSHVLLAKTFIPGWRKGLVVDHIDNNSENNQLNNLQYLTKAENTKKYWNYIKTENPEKYEEFKKSYKNGLIKAHSEGKYSKHYQDLSKINANRKRKKA